MATFQFRIWWNQQSHARFVSLQRNACAINSTFWVQSCNSKFTLGPKPANNPWSLAITFTPVDGDTISIQTSGSASPFNQFGQIREDGTVIASTAASIQRSTPYVLYRWQGAWHEFKERSYTELEDWMEAIRNPTLPHTEPYQLVLKTPLRDTTLKLEMPESEQMLTVKTPDRKNSIALDVPDRTQKLALDVRTHNLGGVA